MDGWGLAYNFFYMPPERHGGYEIESSIQQTPLTSLDLDCDRQEEYGHCAVVNFVDPGFVMGSQKSF